MKLNKIKNRTVQQLALLQVYFITQFSGEILIELVA